MTFEILYENYQITIYYCKNEEENEEEKNNEENEGNTTNGNDSLKINILDMDTMYKYETKINSYEDLDKLPEFMQNLEVISNMICSALKKKSNSVKCHLIKEDDKIILDMIYQAEFFKIPFKIPVLIEPESDNIVFERKMRILQVQNQKLEKTINDFKTNLQKDVDLLKTQLGNVIFLPSCNRPIPIWIKELTLKSKKSVFDEDMSIKLRNKGGTELLHYFSNINICLKSFGSCACNSNCSCSIKKMDYIRGVFSLISHVHGNENTFIFTSNEIEALSLLKNLKKLTIVGNTSIHSIEVFSSLKNLEELNLIECTSITDLTPISCLKNLRKLDISGCHSIKDLTPISSMTDLETLIMKDTKVENKLCLSQLINLKIISEN